MQPRRLGLALGGGGFRGSAHLGVLEVLERIGITVDAISGTSIGALAGALVAAGLRASEIDRVFRNVTPRNLLSRDRERWGLIGAGKLAAILRDLFGDTSIEDLRIPFAAIAVDLTNGAEVALDRGPLVEAILASTAVPGLFPPRRIDGRILADGGLRNNLPVAAARRLGADRVIAVDLLSDDAAFDPAAFPASKPFSWGRLLPTRQLALAERAIILMMQAITERQLRDDPPDLLLTPQVNQIGTGNFLGFDEGRRAGIAAADRQAEQLQALARWRNG